MKAKTIQTAATKAMIRAQLAMTSPKQQQGATALEYIVLAAAIIIIIGVLATSTTVQDALTGAFEGLFSDATSGGA